MVEPRRRFRFLKELSEGAFGKVYMAEMITGDGFSSIVALKLLHGKWAGHQEIAQRSRDEARLLGLLHHRNIVRVEDLSSLNGQCAVIMEYLDGVDLKTMINYMLQNNMRSPRRAAFEITGQIASALEAAYYQTPLKGGQPLHVIHRDIKPSNVMVTAAGDVKVLDFGTARANFEEREAKTQALAFGSQAYMAPERLLGDPDTPAADIFSLGVTLYEYMTLRSFGKIYIRPDKFEASIDERLESMDLSDLPPESAEQVRLVMRSMLSYEGEARPTAGQVVDLMENLAELVNDGSLQRFCRQVVKPCYESVPPRQNSEDPLTGSTLFEDTSTGFIYKAESDVPSEEDLADAAAAAEVPDDDGFPDFSADAAALDVAGGWSASEQQVEPEPEPEPEPGPEHEWADADSSPVNQTPVASPWSSPPGSSLPPMPPPTSLPPSPPGASLPPMPRGGTIPPEPAGTSLPPTPRGGTIPPTPRGGTIPPTPRGGTIPPTPRGGTIPPTDSAPSWQPPVAQSPVAQSPVAQPPVAQSPVAQARPPQARPAPPPDEQLAPSGGGKGKIIAILGVVALLGVAVVIGAVVMLGGDKPAEPPTTPPPVEQAANKGSPGGRYEVGAAGADTGTLRLTVTGASAVNINSTTGFKQDWDGTGTLELVNLAAGSYRTKIEPPKGTAVRATLDVTAGQTCTYTADMAQGGEWQSQGCE